MSTMRDTTTPRDQRGEPGMCGCAGKVSCECGWWMTHCGLHHYFGKPIVCPYCSRSGSLLTYTDFKRPTFPISVLNETTRKMREAHPIAPAMGYFPRVSLSDLPNDGFKPIIWSEIKVKWEQEPMLGFDCPCGVKDLTLSDEELTCECGRVYRQVHRVEVKLP